MDNTNNVNMSFNKVQVNRFNSINVGKFGYPSLGSSYTPNFQMLSRIPLNRNIINPNNDSPYLHYFSDSYNYFYTIIPDGTFKDENNLLNVYFYFNNIVSYSSLTITVNGANYKSTKSPKENITNYNFTKFLGQLNIVLDKKYNDYDYITFKISFVTSNIPNSDSKTYYGIYVKDYKDLPGSIVKSTQ